MSLRIGAIVAVTLLAAGCGSVDATRNPESQAPVRVAAMLDTVPGLAKNDSASVIRDEQIAAYEAWLREEYTRTCVEAAGFEYWPELLYPPDEAADFDIVGLNDLIDSAQPDESAARNRSYRETLSRPQLDAYYQELMGVPLDVIEYLESNDGRLPENHSGSLDEGGCRGDAMTAIGRIWDFRDKVMDELEAVRSDVRQSPIMSEASAALEECSSAFGVPGMTDPGGLEEKYLSASADYAQFKKIESTCLVAWVDTERTALIEAENRFFTEYEDEMMQQIETYHPLYEKSRTDASFARAVAGLLVGL